MCAIISTPANTWSNLAYVAVGVYMLFRAGKNKDLKLFAPAAIATGIFSGLFHASQSRFFQFFDFVGMYMFCMVAVTINCRRLGLFGRQQQVAVYMLGVVTCTLLTPILTAMNIPIQLIVVFLIGCAGITELKAFK